MAEEGYVAIVTGATGLNGAAIIKRLSEDDNCKTIHCISRSLKDEYPRKIKHHSIDLLNEEPKDIAKKFSLEGVKGINYAYFAAYKEENNEEKLCEVNGNMLRNFVQALELTSIHTLRRVILTTGLKFYGLHLGEVRLPMIETDIRVPETFSGTPNFYYVQEDILKEFSNGKKWDYTIAMPNDICGVSKGSYMNEAFTIALYALVCRELHEPFRFPGNEKFYLGFDDISYSKLIADFQLWMTFKAECSEEKFNIVNGDIHSWSRTWPKIAEYFGVEVPKNQFATDFTLSTEVTLSTPSPINLYEKELGIIHTPNSKIINQISLQQWVKQKKVQDAWRTIAERENLNAHALEVGTWAFCDFLFGRTYNVISSMSKARKLGYTGYYDTFDGFKETFDELKKQKQIPQN
ncbi:Epimarase [Schizosaccharomyces pombe]